MEKQKNLFYVNTIICILKHILGIISGSVYLWMLDYSKDWCAIWTKNEEFFEDICWDNYYRDHMNMLVSFDE